MNASTRETQNGRPGMPLSFMADGTLVAIRVGGRDLFREGSGRGGFFALLFDGSVLREIPFEKVAAADDGTLLVVGELGFPRLRFSASAIRGGLRLALAGAEGMPAERDVSLGFRAGLALPCRIEVTGSGVVGGMEDGVLKVFWTDVASGSRGGGHGGVVVIPEDAR